MPLNKGLLTATILTNLVNPDFPVGDGQPPREGGWTSGTPNVGRHVSFVVVDSGSAQGRDMTPAREMHKDWYISYTITSYAVERDRCDELVFATLSLLEGLTPFDFGNHRARKLSPESIGATSRVTNQDPPLWSCAANFNVHAVPLT